jgi:hypothetical protein
MPRDDSLLGSATLYEDEVAEDSQAEILTEVAAFNHLLTAPRHSFTQAARAAP